MNGCYSHDFYLKKSSELDLWIDSLSKVAILTTFDEDIMIIKQLATGTGTVVNLCEYIEDSTQYAIKTVNKNLLALRPELLQGTVNEISALRITNHPNIVKLYKVYETNTEVHLLLEYLPCGSLFKKLLNIKKMPENDVLIILAQILDALRYLNSIHIIHRDIKLENIVFADEEKLEIKIVDFGLACRYNCGLVQKCGSPGCVAPEILRGNYYGYKVDMFSVGILMYTLLTGKMLFQGKNSAEVLENNKKCDIDIENMNFFNVSDEVIDLLNRLLTIVPKSRISVKKALNFDCIIKVIEYNNNCTYHSRGKGCSTHEAHKSKRKQNTVICDLDHSDSSFTRSLHMKNNFMY